MSCLNVRITGVVQGVGYRYHIARRATEFSLAGWVKNRSDGSVEIEAVGPRESLDDFLSYIRIGPAGASVTGVTASWSESEPAYKGFDIRF